MPSMVQMRAWSEVSIERQKVCLLSSIDCICMNDPSRVLSNDVLSNDVLSKDTSRVLSNDVLSNGTSRVLSTMLAIIDQLQMCA